MRILALFLLIACRLHAAQEATVHLYGYMGLEWLPFTEAELLSVKPGLVRFKAESREIEHSGRFSIEQPAPKREERKWWQIGSAPKPERVDTVILYGFMKLAMMPFNNVDLFEKKEGFIVFEAGRVRYTHCGRYSIER